MLYALCNACPLQRARWFPSKGGEPTLLHYGDKMVTPDTTKKEPVVKKTIGIKLNLLIPQEHEIKQLFSAFQAGINWSLLEIEKRYQIFLSTYSKLPESAHGICAGCNTEKDLYYIHKITSQKHCTSCALKTYSEYTVRKEVYGTGDREVAQDLKDVVAIPNKTHYDSIFSQAYAMWKSYNAWRDKRARELELALQTITGLDQRWVSEAQLVEKKAADIKNGDKNLTWKQAKVRAFNEVYYGHTDKEKDLIAEAHDRLMDVRRLQRPIHFPQLEECRTVKMNAGFVQWDNGELYLTLFEKGRQKINFWGKKYLEQYISKMEADNKVYCNLSRKGNDYYLMYPLEIKIRQPPAISECDTFVFMTSPTKAGVFGYDADGVLSSTRWAPTGQLTFAKRHFKEKRAEIARRRHPEEKMRRIHRRRKTVVRKGAIEQRYVSTFNHQLTRWIIDSVIELSENPKLLIWDVGNGITQNFGKQLNYFKNLFPAVQQQDYLKHKAMQVSIPVIEVQYNKCNDLVCSSCGAKQMNGSEAMKKKKPMKVITQLIKNVKNFKCQKCGYEVNMLINQANNVCASLYKGADEK